MRKALLAFTPLIIVLFGGDVLAQNRSGPFAPPVGQNGTTAMYKDSSAFETWAVHCTVTRGLQDTSDPSLGYASSGTPSDATDKAGVNGVVSLGDHGKATLEFDEVIKNGPGPDFAVFENSFDDSFLELGFVEVSSNGNDFARFPAVSLTDTTSQVGTFGSLDATDLYNLAGKYRKDYGTPFDLEALKGHPAIDTDSITKVRIVDAIGCVQDSFATYDSTGRAVNDPWPTDFASGGFDLDAVGVVHTRNATGLADRGDNELQLRYVPDHRQIRIEGKKNAARLRLYDLSGRLVLKDRFDGNGAVQVPRSVGKGVHILRLSDPSGSYARKLFIR